MEENQITTKKTVTGLTPTATPVSRETFDDATNAWSEFSHEHNGMIDNVILPNYFNIPMSDILALAEEFKRRGLDKSIGVRAFVGLDEYGEYNGVSNTSEMKLFLTGIDPLFQPIFEEGGTSAIYDFVTPCPPTCKMTLIE